MVVSGAVAPGGPARRGGDHRLEAAGAAGFKSTRAAWGSRLVFADESGRNLKPPKGRTWVRTGQTPVLPASYARGPGRPLSSSDGGRR